MRKPAVLLAGGCLALLTVAACGAQAESSTGPSLTQAAAPSATGTSIPRSLPTTAPRQTTTHPAAGGQTFVPATGIAPGDATMVPSAKITAQGMAAPPRDVHTSGRTVAFTYPQSGCEHVVARTAAQAATSVTIQVETLVSGSTGQMCPLIVRAVPLHVTLTAPLGGRQLVFQHVTGHRS